MWKVPVLLLVFGRALLWVRAGGAPTLGPEDAIMTTSVENSMVTGGASEGSTGLTTQAPTNPKSTGSKIEDVSTPESTGHAQEGSQSTTASSVAPSHSTENTETAVEKDGLVTGTLVGIIIGVILAVGFVGGVIVVIVRKMSGRYSP